jgi:hypothetical protein
MDIVELTNRHQNQITVQITVQDYHLVHNPNLHVCNPHVLSQSHTNFGPTL